MTWYMRPTAGGALERVDGSTPIVFHHLPKTAGSTLRTILENFFSEDQVCPHEVEYALKELPSETIAKYRFFAGHYSYPFIVDNFPNAVRLVVLRNPVQRVISQYYNLHDYHRVPEHWKEHFRNAPPEFMDFIDIIQRASLEEVIESNNGYALSLCRNYQTHYLTSRSVAPFYGEPEPAVLYDPDMVKEAKDNLLKSFAFVGVQEEFRLTLNLLCSMFGLFPFGDTSAMNRNYNPRKLKGHDCKPSRELLERLYELNRMDVEVWEYARCLLLERTCESLGVAKEEVLPHEPTGNTGKQFIPLSKCGMKRGFYWREEDGRGKEFYWSGYEQPAVMEIDMFIPAGAQVVVRLHVLSAFDDDFLKNTTFELNDSPLKMDVEREQDEIVLVGISKKTTSQRRVNILKIYSEAAMEFEDGGRMLSLAISGATIEIV